MDDEVVFSVQWFDIITRAVAGSQAPYYLLRTSDYVSVLAASDKGAFLLVRQYRPAVRQETLELPSGHVEPGELPEIAARRELAEETGYEAAEFELLGTLVPDSGRLANKLWCYYAHHATQIVSPKPKAEEGVTLVRCDRGDLARFVRDGNINHALHLAVLLLAATRGRLELE